jgi:uncharacterized protein YwgA
MNRSEILLAALAAGGENATYTPVQVQKLFFLLDREASKLLDGPHFDFQPYDYGPFDQAVYSGLEELSRRGLIQVHNAGKYRTYGLSQDGFNEGENLLYGLPPNAVGYVKSVATWIRQLSFQQLVASIYNRYPEMKAKSVFRG